jgi:hypothetical protein
MIPCFICGRNAENGWIKGFPPAPDSQKLGLCKAHDTDFNRDMVTDQWQKYLKRAISGLNSANARKFHDSTFLLNIFFTGGGCIAVPCLNCSTPDQDLLKVTTPDGETFFFPLRQVRHYSLTPLKPASAEQTTSLAPGTDDSDSG